MASSINASTSGAGGVITTADNTGILNLQTASTTAVTVDASQNVGIGTTSPSQRLHVKSNNGQILAEATGTNENPSIKLTSATNNRNWEIFSWGASAGQFGIYDGIAGQNRLLIDTSGNVIIGGNSTIAGYVVTMYHTDTGGMAYKYNGTSQQNSCSFQNGNGQVGRIYTSGTATTYATSSDYRLKENVIPMTGALNKIAQLNPVTFTWKTDGTDGQGFIAHELQAVVPDCVGGEKDAVDAEGNPVYQDIDTSFLVATLTAAIKEQQTIINDLKARVTALEAK